MIFETTSKERRFSKAVKVLASLQTSVFVVDRILDICLNFELRSSDEQDLMCVLLLSNVNLALFLSSNITHYYQNRFLLTCE